MKPKKYIIKTKPMEAIRYTTPKSVMQMMDAWGSMGFNNSLEGLCINQSEEYPHVNKGEWVVNPHPGTRKFFVFKNDAFKRIFKVVKSR